MYKWNQYDFSKVINVMDDAYWEQITNGKVNRKKTYICLWISLILEPLDFKKDGSSLKISLLLLLLFFLSSTELKCNPDSFHWWVWQCCCCHCSFAFKLVQPVLLFSHSASVQLCNPMECRIPGFSVLHYLPESAQIHVHWVGDGVQPSHALLPPSPPALNLSQHQGLSRWVGSLH